MASAPNRTDLCRVKRYFNADGALPRTPPRALPLEPATWVGCEGGAYSGVTSSTVGAHPHTQPKQMDCKGTAFARGSRGSAPGLDDRACGSNLPHASFRWCDAKRHASAFRCLALRISVMRVGTPCSSDAKPTIRPSTSRLLCRAAFPTRDRTSALTPISRKPAVARRPIPASVCRHFVPLRQRRHPRWLDRRHSLRRHPR